MRPWPTVLMGVGLAVTTLIFELLHLPLPYPSDQTSYLEAARTFPHPLESIPDHHALRFGLVIPMRIALGLFGYSQAAYYAVPVLAGVSLSLAVYVLGTLMFSRIVGIAAAVVTIANNVVFYDLLQPLPDLLATSLFCWALALAVMVRQQRPPVSATPRRRALALLVIGALLGWSYLTREFIVLAWPLLPAVLLRSVRWRDWLWLIAPMATTVVVELTLSAIAVGDPLARLRAVSTHGSGAEIDRIAGTFQDKPRLWYVSRLVNGMGDVPEGVWLQAALVVTLVVGLLLRRKLGLLAAWILTFSVPLLLLGGIINPSQPMLRLFKMRYWFPVFPPIVLGGLAAISVLVTALARSWRPTRPRQTIVAATAVLVCASATTASASPAWNDTSGYRVMETSQMSAFRTWLTTSRSDVTRIWTDGRTRRILPIYTHHRFGGSIWDGPIRALTQEPGLPQAGDHVVLFSTRDPPLCSHCKQAAEHLFGAPVDVPDTWRLVYSTEDEQLLIYVVT